MLRLSLREIQEATQAHFLKPWPAADSQNLDSLFVSSIVTDSRTVSPASLFIAISGERVEGARFAKAVLEAGAVAVLTDAPEVARASGADPSRLLCVPDSVKALGDIARYHMAKLRRLNPQLRVIGVTGSVGKTTTKDLLAQMMKEKGEVIAPKGSFNNEIGLPLTTLQAGLSTDVLVLEMGADHVGNIDYLTSIAPLDSSAILRIGSAHVGEFGSVENIAKAKSEILDGTASGGTIVLNGDDERVRALASHARGPVIFYSAQETSKQQEISQEQESSQEKESDLLSHNETHGVYVRARDLSDEGGHARFTLDFSDLERHRSTYFDSEDFSDGVEERNNSQTLRDGAHTNSTYSLTLALAGIHHVYNALASAALAWAAGVSTEHIVEVLRTCTALSPHRMNVKDVRGMRIIDDAYNANPDSMRAALQAFPSLAADFEREESGRPHRRVAIIGSMLELGERSEREHASLAPYIREAGIDLLILVGSQTAPTARALKESLTPIDVISFADSPQALESVPSLLARGDTVLCKGSFGTGVWKIADYVGGISK